MMAIPAQSNMTPPPSPSGKEASASKVASLTPQGLAVLQVMSKLHRIPVDIQALIREQGLVDLNLAPEQVIRLSQGLGFKAKLKTKLEPLKVIEQYKLPAVAILPVTDPTSEGYGYAVALRQNPESKKILMFLAATGQTEEWELERLPTDWIVMHPKSKLKQLEFNLMWFFREILHYRKIVLEVMLGSFVVQCFGLLTPLFTQVILDKVIVHQSLGTLDVLGVAFIAIVIFEFLLNLARNYIFTHTASKLDVKLGRKLFEHLFSLSAGYFESRKVGDTLARVRELETIRSFLTQKSVSLILDLFFSLVFVGMMLLYSVQLTLIVLAFVAVVATVYVLVTPSFRSRLEHKFQMGAQNNSYLVESLTGVQTVKALAIEGMMQRQWEDKLGHYVKSGFDLSKLQHLMNATASGFQRLMTLAILYFGVRLVIDGDLTVGQLIAFNMFAGQFTAPVLRLVNLWHELQQVLLGVDRVGDILNQPTETEQGSGITLPQIRGELQFKHVDFRYTPTGGQVLRDLNLTIPAGTCLGIVGRSGSGKSTLTKLVQKLYLAQSGLVMLDGVDIRQMNPRWLRYQIGVVLQENYLFSGTIRDNISMARPDAPMAQIIEAAQMAGAHEFITELPEGYDTMVGERGASLSGGQRQRVAIARALITNPRVLILDEATSALDVESELIIQKNLAKIQKGRTVLIIAHRLSTVRQCDRIIVMEKGQIEESGTHRDLIREGGIYAQMVKQQQGEATESEGGLSHVG